MRNINTLATCLLALCLAVSAAAWTPWGAIYGSARDERSVGDQAKDKETSLSIKKALADSDSKKALQVHVYCFLGNVFLIGGIDDVKFRDFSVRTAQGTEGVTKVTSHFVAESDTTADDLEIATKVRAALIGEGDLSATQVEQEVLNGEVVLLGMVRSKADAALAVKTAKGVEGVRKVTSYLIPPK